MNSNVKTSIVQMEKDELRKLVTQVPETIASEIDVNEKPYKFSAADLWRIQKQKRSIRLRRNML